MGASCRAAAQTFWTGYVGNAHPTPARSEVVPLTAMAKSCLCMYRIDNIFSPKMYGLCVWFARCPIRVTYANCVCWNVYVEMLKCVCWMCMLKCVCWMCMLKCALKHIYSFCWLIMLRNTLKEQHNCCVSWWMIKKKRCVAAMLVSLR